MPQTIYRVKVTLPDKTEKIMPMTDAQYKAFLLQAKAAGATAEKIDDPNHPQSALTCPDCGRPMEVDQGEYPYCEHCDG